MSDEEKQSVLDGMGRNAHAYGYILFIVALGAAFVQPWSVVGSQSSTNGFLVNGALASNWTAYSSAALAFYLIGGAIGTIFCLWTIFNNWGAHESLLSKDAHDFWIWVSQFFLLLTYIMYECNDYNPYAPTFYIWNTDWRTGTNATTTTVNGNVNFQLATASTTNSYIYAWVIVGLFFMLVAGICWLLAAAWRLYRDSGPRFLFATSFFLFVALTCSTLYYTDHFQTEAIFQPIRSAFTVLWVSALFGLLAIFVAWLASEETTGDAFASSGVGSCFGWVTSIVSPANRVTRTGSIKETGSSRG